MAIRAVLFDFSGTLFQLEHPNLDESADLIRLLTAPVGRVDDLDSSSAKVWHRRDLDPQVHRSVHVTMLRNALVPDPEALYDSMLNPQNWRPYPDTVETLKALRTVPVAVVSNIGWDIRAVFEQWEVAHFVDEFVLSYEVNMVKPNPQIFLTACERLGIAPQETIMVGDSEVTDGGATAIGCQFRLVNSVPTVDRPAALLPIARAIISPEDDRHLPAEPAPAHEDAARTAPERDRSMPNAARGV